MMKLICICLSVTALHAALPPLAQSSREVKEIVADPRLYQALGGAEAISQIVKVDGGYEVYTAHQAVLVKVHYLQNKLIGPAQFELEFGTAVAR